MAGRRLASRLTPGSKRRRRGVYRKGEAAAEARIRKARKTLQAKIRRAKVTLRKLKAKRLRLRRH